PNAIRFSLLLGAVAAIVAAITGYLLSRNGGYQTEVLQFHQWLGVGVAVVSVGAFLLYLDRPTSYKWVHILQEQRFIFILTAVVLLAFTGHFGGTLTHGEGYMKDALPTA